jgi:hypothetical protein
MDEYDDRTLLDTFGEVAKEYLTQKVIPETDLECKWDWRFVQCEPFCECAFLPRRGDYHLGRSCRRRTKLIEECDPESSTRPMEIPLQIAIQKVVQRSQKAVQSVANRTRKSYETIQTNVCGKLPAMECSEGKLPEIAWQERLLCRKMIPDCQPGSSSAAAAAAADEDV